MIEQFTLVVTDQEILNIIDTYDEAKRVDVATKALRIGLIAVKDIETTGKVDYVEKEFESFREKINKLVEKLDKDIEDRLEKSQSDLEKSLKDNLDPQNGIMSRVLDKYLGDGGSLADLFDEKKNDSAVSKIKSILGEYFDDDASRVVRLLDANNEQSPLRAFKKDIMDRLVEIQGEIKAAETGKQAAKAEANKGTQKGRDYEDLVFLELERIAVILGDTCVRTSTEKGHVLNSLKGDFVVDINPAETGGTKQRMVFETKDKMVSVREMLNELEDSMKNRAAGQSIGVLSGVGLFKDACANVGVLRDYSPDKSFCVFDKDALDAYALEVGYKLARARSIQSVKAEDMKGDAINLTEVNRLTRSINKKLSDFSIIKTALTKSINSIEDAKTKTDALQNELNDMLDELYVKVSLEDSSEVEAP